MVVACAAGREDHARLMFFHEDPFYRDDRVRYQGILRQPSNYFAVGAVLVDYVNALPRRGVRDVFIAVRDVVDRNILGEPTVVTLEVAFSRDCVVIVMNGVTQGVMLVCPTIVAVVVL